MDSASEGTATHSRTPTSRQNLRRRRRSPSSDGSPSEGGNQTQRSSVTEEEPEIREDSIPAGRASHARSPQERPSSRKRRRLMSSRTMRLESETVNSNGSRHLSNGSQHPTPQKNEFSHSANACSADTNGTNAVYWNGSSQSIARTRTPSFFGHDREEVTRLLIQGLADLGYQGAADRLSQESGYEVESPSVAAFRHAVLQGEWSEAESLLFGSSPIEDGGGVSIMNGDSHPGLKLAEGADSNQMRFRMREQKYLELLEDRDLGSALMVLRQELTPLHQDVGKLHHLSRYVFSDTITSLGVCFGKIGIL